MAKMGLLLREHIPPADQRKPSFSAHITLAYTRMSFGSSSRLLSSEMAFCSSRRLWLTDAFTPPLRSNRADDDRPYWLTRPWAARGTGPVQWSSFHDFSRAVCGVSGCASCCHKTAQAC